ncbi:MAG: tetratricopeptide repeat protein [Flammeovirgaceae bacterium]|jgi:signal transduction histidine kinase|nr:tetratricopeptide repeat protein [Flammeovirgaceae bacterium]
MLRRFLHKISGRKDGLTKKILFSLVYIICINSSTGIAQAISKADSLRYLIEKEANEFRKIDLQNELAFKLYDNSDSIGLQVAQQALVQSRRLHYVKGEKRALTLTGIGFYSVGKYARAKQALLQSTRLSTESDDPENHYNQAFLGTVYFDLGLFDSALYILQKTEAEIKKSANIKYLSKVYRTKAKVQLALWKTSEALASLKLAEASQVSKNLTVQAEIYFLYFSAYTNSGNFLLANEYANKICEAGKKEPTAYTDWHCNYSSAEIAIHHADYQRAIDHLFYSLKLAQKLGNQYLRAQTYLKLAEVYDELSELNLAADFAFIGLRITQQAKMNALTAELYATLGWISKGQKNYAKSLEFIDEAERIRVLIGDKRGVANGYNIKGLVYMLEGKYALSEEFHKKALSIRQTLGYKAGISASLFNLALVYQEQKKYEEALNLQNQALQIDKEIGDISNLAISYNAISELLLKVNRLKESKEYADISLELAKRTNSKLLLRNAYENYSEYFEVTGNYKAANQYLKITKAINDSLYNESMSRKLAELNTIYDLDKKQREIEALTNEKILKDTQLKLKDAKLQNQFIIIIVGSLGFILIGVFTVILLNYSRKVSKAKKLLVMANQEMADTNEELRKLNNQLLEKQEEIQAQAEELAESNETLVKLNEDVLEKQEELAAQAEELREANDSILQLNAKLEERVEQRTSQLKLAFQELDTFFYRSSHDFRRPITTFMGLTEVAKITVKDKVALELFEKVNDTAFSLDKMIRKLQAISDVSAHELELKEVVVNDLIENVFVRYKDEAENKNIALLNETEQVLQIKSFPTLLTLILENLIENSILFCGMENSFVKIICYKEKGKLIVEVHDNGQGIQEEYLPKIFDMYFRANVSSRGNGLGLYIVRKAVDKLHGDLHNSTVLHEGTTIKVIIPVMV